jgi:hypothetical protein
MKMPKIGDRIRVKTVWMKEHGEAIVQGFTQRFEQKQDQLGEEIPSLKDTILHLNIDGHLVDALWGTDEIEVL